MRNSSDCRYILGLPVEDSKTKGRTTSKVASLGRSAPSRRRFHFPAFNAVALLESQSWLLSSLSLCKPASASSRALVKSCLGLIVHRPSTDGGDDFCTSSCTHGFRRGGVIGKPVCLKYRSAWQVGGWAHVSACRHLTHGGWVSCDIWLPLECSLQPLSAESVVGAVDSSRSQPATVKTTLNPHVLIT